MRVAATIAILNEEKNIGHVLRRMPAGIDVVVVDDGSKDNSGRVAREHGARVVRHPANLGQGMAVITGFRALLMEDYDVIVALDGDGQHDPQDIPRFVAKMEETGVDIVVGSRLLGSNHASAPLFRRKFLPLVNASINMVTGYQMTDTMCGYRAYRASSLRRVQHIFEQILEPQYMSAEMFVRLSREGLTVAEIPVNLGDRLSGMSHKGLIRYGFGVSRAIVRTIFS